MDGIGDVAVGVKRGSDELLSSSLYNSGSDMSSISGPNPYLEILNIE